MDGKNGMKVKRNDDAIWRVIDGDVVVLLPEGAMFHALTGCGSRVWELIEDETAIPEIVQKICEEYDVESRRANKEITEFVQKLIDMKLAKTVPTGEETND